MAGRWVSGHREQMFLLRILEKVALTKAFTLKFHCMQYSDVIQEIIINHLRSVQRDGGARLEGFSGKLWHNLRDVRYDLLNKNKMRMRP